jgi:hypothetical protein
MQCARIVWLAVVLCGCSYEFVEGPNEAAEDESEDSSGADDAGTDDGGQDQPDTGGATEDTGSPDLCGNGVVDPPEQCDLQDFSGRDCMSLGFKSGTLVCTEECELDTSMCND